MWFELVGWSLVALSFMLAFISTPWAVNHRRLRHLRVEARGLVAIHGAGLIYGPWVANRASEFCEPEWQDRVRRVLCAEFEREFRRQGIWEEHVRMCIALKRAIGE